MSNRVIQILLTVLALVWAGSSRAASAPDSVSIARASLKAGQVFYEQGNFQAAIASLEEGLGILRRNAPDDGSLHRAEIQLAVPLAETGQYGLARELIDEGLAGIENASPVDSVDLGTALNAKGRVLTLMGDLDASRLVLERALAIRQQSLAPDDSRIAMTLNNLANVYSARNDLKASRPIYRRLIALEEARTPPDSLQLAMYLNNCANATSDLGDVVEGRELYGRALAIRERVLGPMHPRLVSTLMNLASLDELERDFSAALSHLERGGDIAERSLGSGHPVTAELWIDKAVIEWRIGKYDSAFEDAAIGEQATMAHLKRTAPWISSSQALRYEESRLSGLGILMQVVARNPAESPQKRERALDALVRSRAVMLDEFANRSRFLAENADTGLARLEREWSDAAKRFASFSLAGLGGAARDTAYRRNREEAERVVLEAETALARRSATVRARAAEERIALEDIVQAMPARTALVSIVRYAAIESVVTADGRPRYLAFVLRAGEVTPAAFDLGDANPIDSLLARWRRAVGPSLGKGTPAEQEVAYRRVSAALRDRVWKPLGSILANSDLVFVVPDGAFHGFSFATLPAGSGYLVEKRTTFHTLSTERDLVRTRHDTERGAGLLAIGGVDFDRQPKTAKGGAPSPSFAALSRSMPCTKAANLKFGRLPATAEEAFTVSSLWRRYGGDPGAVRVLSGSEASKVSFERLAPGFGTIHVATHGFAFDAGCADEDDEGSPARPEDFLFRCGLVLAGANRMDSTRFSPDGGFLTAAEIAAMDLHRARWVVLSACGSGLGSIAEQEGLFGLQRAFQLAGAGTIIVSLWDVGDTDTRLWMTALYRSRLKEGRNAPEAAAEASRQLLHQLRAVGASTHPSRWGAFISSGDWR